MTWPPRLAPLLSALRRWLLAPLGLLVLLVSFTPLVPWWARQLAGPWHDPQGDILILLSGSLHSIDAGHGPIIGHNTYFRTLYALRAWRSGKFRRILISGDAPTATGMQQYLQAAGVPDDALLLDRESTATRLHPAHCRAILARYPGRAVLLTSDFHMFRAHAAFRRAGVPVDPYPIPDVIKMSSFWVWRWQGFLLLAEESVKIAYYRFQGWI